jgi:hypothetical protein
VVLGSKFGPTGCRKKGINHGIIDRENTVRFQMRTIGNVTVED